MALSSLRSVSVLPLGSAVVGLGLLFGTMIGQAGHDEGNAALSAMDGMNMPGMDHGGGAAPGGAMPGMDMSGKDAGMDMSGKDAGMDMSGKDAGMDMSGKDAGMDMSGKDAGMDMSGSAAAAKPMVMKPGMAAGMPGGVHSTCTGSTSCSAIFAKGASGTASLLGQRTRLSALSANTAILTVGGHKVVLHRQKAVRYHGLTLKITRLTAGEVWIRVVKAR